MLLLNRPAQVALLAATSDTFTHMCIAGMVGVISTFDDWVEVIEEVPGAGDE
jgi:hypothetical protein